MKRTWLGLFLSCIVWIGCSVDREYDCGDHGEYVEGDCFCEQGWTGNYCDEWVVDRNRGDYALISDTCGILWWGMDSIHITTSLVMPLGFFIHGKGLRNAITAEYRNASDYPIIPFQKVTAITASGQDSIFQLDGDVATPWYDPDRLYLSTGVDTCFAVYRRY